tara:strand:- start:573 stop:1535 length:963 start_codon:yes stop_codon:yes gene_type:complete
MKFKIIFILIFTLYQTSVYSKVTEAGQFNQKYLSKYFSALLSSNNQNNNDALKYFESSKFLIQKHDNFLKEYVYSLVLDGQIKKAIKQVKHSQNQDFFEARLLLALESFNKKNYKKTEKRLNNLESFKDDGTYEFLIYKIFQSYNNLFLNNKVENIGENFGKLNLITKAFQNCYLNSNKTRTYFLNIINSEQGDYSRYLFFYLGNLIENKEYKIVNEISQSINVHNSSLLISQAKNWIEQKKLKKFDKYFSCKNEKDILAEFFFLISNLFSSEDNFEQSNFYLNLSIYLNPKFYFNLSLLAENYYNNENLDLSKKNFKYI